MPRLEPIDGSRANIITASLPTQFDKGPAANTNVAQKPIIVSGDKLNSRLHQGAADIAGGLPPVALEIGAIIRLDPGADRIPADADIVPNEFVVALKP